MTALGTTSDNSPLVSICLPTYCRFEKGLLQRALNSISQQTYIHYELLIVDDGSVDGTAEYVKELARNDSRVRVLTLGRHIGLPAYSMARAYLESRGELLAFVADDSCLKPRHLELLVSALRDPEIGLAYGQTQVHAPRGSEILGRHLTLKELEIENQVGNSAVMLRKSVIKDVGYYDPHILLKRWCDWDLWLRVWKRHRVTFIESIISEEFGPQLPESLCRSTSLFPELTRKYMREERNSSLAPEKIVSRKSQMNVQFELSDEERKLLSYLALEHYIEVGNTEEIVECSLLILASQEDQALRLWSRISNSEAVETMSESQLLLFGFKYYSEFRGAKNDLLSVFDRLDDLEDEAKELHSRYHQLQRSASWRITRPLRELKTLVTSFTAAEWIR